MTLPKKNITLQEGMQVPDFEAVAGDGRQVRLSDFRGRNVILYFYPKNMTPACTEQACDFRDRHKAIGDADTVVLGVSTNSAKEHAKFAAKYGLPFTLLADEEHRLADLFGVWQMKKLYGREYMGIVRSTFLIGKTGKLAKAWRNIRVKGHAEDVLTYLKQEINFLS